MVFNKALIKRFNFPNSFSIFNCTNKIKFNKRKQNISKIENELSSYNSKSVNYKKFKKFIKKKNELNKILLEKYQNEIFRKYKWYGYINRKKAETDLIRDIKNTFVRDGNKYDLTYKGEQLEDDKTLGNYSIMNGCTIVITTPKPIGGARKRRTVRKNKIRRV